MQALDPDQTQHRPGEIMQMKRTMAVLAAGALWAVVACAQQPAYQQPPAYQAPPANSQQPNQSAPNQSQQPAGQQQPAYQQQTSAGQQPPAYQQQPPAGQQQPAYQQQSDQPPPPAREPTLNVSPYRHGNIARAQEYSRYAFDAMTQAQQSNEFDMGGHAEHAKQLLAQANDEMKLAAEWANHRH
jgi:hypothetical protein